MRHREPTAVERLATHAGLLGHHDTQRNLLRLPDSESIEAFVAAAANAQFWILGFEGFEVLGDSVRPDIEAIADLLTCSSAAESRREARAALIELRDRPIAFDFSLRT